MRHLRRLIESRPMLLRAPDQSILAMDPGEEPDHVQACRAIDGSYAMIYTPNGGPLRIRLDRISGRIRAWWYDPTCGVSYLVGEYPNRGAKPSSLPHRASRRAGCSSWTTSPGTTPRRARSTDEALRALFLKIS